MASGRLIGTIVQTGTSTPIPARLYVTGSDGKRHYPTPSVPHPAKRELEGHVITLGKPFEVELPAGKVIVRIERGPEWVPVEQSVEIPKEGTVEKQFALRRWIDMAELGWFSGDAHSHTRLAEIHALLAGEDLNVAMPITAWDHRRDPDLEMFAQHATPRGVVHVCDRRLFTIYNQEYEPARSPAGAVLLMGMDRVIDGRVAPPLEPLFDLTHQRGGFVDMEKHSWAWAPVVAAAGKCDVFEIANNHHWREKCLYVEFEVPSRSLKPDYPLDIVGWTLYGFDSWYAYLNCGFNLKPTAGTAHGVHPNPLGHSRAYVNVVDPRRPDTTRGLSADAWQRNLLAGRSFVTTGPLLFFEAAGRAPGDELQAVGRPVPARVRLMSLAKPERIDIIRGGDVVHSFPTDVPRGHDGVYRFDDSFDVPVDSTTYLAARVFVEPPDRTTVRFAHSGVVRVRVPGKPLLPRKFEVDHFLHRVASMIAEIKAGKLKAGDTAAALGEYERALLVYQRLAANVRDE